MQVTDFMLFHYLLIHIIKPFAAVSFGTKINKATYIVWLTHKLTTLFIHYLLRLVLTRDTWTASGTGRVGGGWGGGGNLTG